MRISAISMFVLVLACCSNSASAIEHTKDSLTTVRKNIESGKGILVDVRERDEWDEGHLHDATHYALSQMKEDAEGGPSAFGHALLKQKIILYCHCRSGNRALKAGTIFKNWGFDVRPLEAGYDELVEAGFKPAKKSP